jgi:hypothetical protein
MPIPQELVIEAINKMAFYLCSNCRRDGKFVYLIDKNTDEYVDTYNVLRHAGAIYSLTEFAKISPNAKRDVLPVVARSIKWMRKKCSVKILDYQGIITNKRITKKKEKSQIKLGANALAILALLGYNNLKPGMVNESYLKKLANFMVYMQKDDGSFYSKYMIDGGQEDDWESSYYPGEAALAFAELDDGYYFNKALSALSRLATNRQALSESEIESDHWALIATSKVIKNNLLPEYSKHLLSYHAEQIANSIAYNWNIVLSQHRTTPISTRMEGLIAYLNFADEFNFKTDDVFHIVEQGISFLLKAYERRGSYVGGVTRDFEPNKKDSRSDEIRIDYVQHALCAMLNFYHICMNKDYWNVV